MASKTAFGALSVEEMVSQPQPVKRKRVNESEKDAGGEADEGEEQGQDLTSILPSKAHQALLASLHHPLP